ncbi:MAG: hypothetical protein IJW20_01210 [Clostridia bacterium]|nr:hypothetical protein [Clostridia bacterium]
MKKRKINLISTIIIIIILCIISIFGYKYIFEVETLRSRYAEESVELIENNNNPLFRIGQIILYSSANATDNSEGQLKNIDISQFTDMSIYIDNKGKVEEIKPENTINELYITNIKIESASENGEKIFNYKNPKKTGKYVELSNWQQDGILFSIINTNPKNDLANYDENVFYTDCSNPISLGFINKNILTNCEVSGEVGTINFDGSILKNANINLADLKTKISFSINITNNYNEKYVCDLELDLDLTEEEEIYSGYAVKMFKPEGAEYNFIKVSDK